MSRRDQRPDGRWVFATDDVATTVDGTRHLIPRGKRYPADDPIVAAHPNLFRPFTPPTLDE